VHVKYIVVNEYVQCNLFVTKTYVMKGEIDIFHAINVYVGVAVKIHSFLILILCH